MGGACGGDEADVVEDEARLPLAAVAPQTERDRPGPPAAHRHGAEVHPHPGAGRHAARVERAACGPASPAVAARLGAGARCGGVPLGAEAARARAIAGFELRPLLSACALYGAD